MSSLRGLDRGCRAPRQRGAVRQIACSYVRPAPRPAPSRDAVAVRAKSDDVQVRRFDDGSTMYTFGDGAGDKASRGSGKAEAPASKPQPTKGTAAAPSKDEQGAGKRSGDGGAKAPPEQTSKEAEASAPVKQPPAEAPAKGGDAKPTRRRSTGAPRRKDPPSDAKAKQQPPAPAQSVPEPPRQAQAKPAPPKAEAPQAEIEYADHALPRVALMDQLVGAEPTAQQASQNGAAVAVADPPAAAPAEATTLAQPSAPPTKAAPAKKQAAKAKAASGQASDQPSPAGGSVEELRKLTVKELTTLCKERGIKGYSSLRKAQLVDLLATGTSS